MTVNFSDKNLTLVNSKLVYHLNAQVPGSQDGSVSNSPLLPQQDCPAFAGDAVLNGAFKKISNSVDC